MATPGFRPSTTLIRVLLAALVIGAAFDLVAAFSSHSQYRLLRQLQDGVEVPEDVLTASDDAQQIVGGIQLALFIATTIMFCVWTHRVISQAWRVNPSRLTISPGWAVGFYFIPIANLWKPYQALRDAFEVIGEVGQIARGRNLFPLWWGAWMISNVLGQASFRLLMRAEEIDEYVFAGLMTTISDGFDVGLGIIAFLLVREVSAAYLQSNQPPPLDPQPTLMSREAFR